MIRNEREYQEALRRLKEDESLKTLPTVILTTSNAENDVVAAYTNGAGCYLVKPVDFRQFSELLKTLGTYWMSWNHHSKT